MSGKVDLPLLRLAVCHVLHSDKGAFGWKVLSLEEVFAALGADRWRDTLNRRTLAPKHVTAAVERLLVLGFIREEIREGEVLYSLTELARPLFLSFVDQEGRGQAIAERVRAKVVLGYTLYAAQCGLLHSYHGGR